jgi:SAM-dependent methyltransferase
MPTGLACRSWLWRSAHHLGPQERITKGTEVHVDTDPNDHALAWLEHREGRVSIEERADGRRRVLIHPNPGTFVSRRECSTAYPVGLIQRILQVKSPGHLCDEIARDEDPDYLHLDLRYSLLGYLPHERFKDARILDFGSGSGASTIVLARMFPDTEIVGVELEPDFIAIARMRAEYYGLLNVVFHESPSAENLPDDLGQFDFINLGAVYEHLLPDERPRLLTQLWAVLKVGGVIFVNQLPYRFYPIEAHTTNLPLLNYLPAPLACKAAKRFSPRIGPGSTWERLLRRGIRGGTERSVRRDLLRGGGEARTLVPTMMGFRDHTDLWYDYSMQRRPHPVKRVMRTTFRAVSYVTDTPVAPGLSLAFEKLA